MGKPPISGRFVYRCEIAVFFVKIHLFVKYMQRLQLRKSPDLKITSFFVLSSSRFLRLQQKTEIENTFFSVKFFQWSPIENFFREKSIFDFALSLYTAVFSSAFHGSKGNFQILSYFPLIKWYLLYRFSFLYYKWSFFYLWKSQCLRFNVMFVFFA